MSCCWCCTVQADRATEELYNAIVKNDLHTVYEKINDGADVNFVFGAAYSCPEGYTPLMVACHRGRLECAKALLRAGVQETMLMYWICSRLLRQQRAAATAVRMHLLSCC